MISTKNLIFTIVILAVILSGCKQDSSDMSNISPQNINMQLSQGNLEGEQSEIIESLNKGLNEKCGEFNPSKCNPFVLMSYKKAMSKLGEDKIDSKEFDIALSYWKAFYSSVNKIDNFFDFYYFYKVLNETENKEYRALIENFDSDKSYEKLLMLSIIKTWPGQNQELCDANLERIENYCDSAYFIEVIEYCNQTMPGEQIDRIKLADDNLKLKDNILEPHCHSIVKQFIS